MSSSGFALINLSNSKYATSWNAIVWCSKSDARIVFHVRDVLSTLNSVWKIGSFILGCVLYRTCDVILQVLNLSGGSKTEWKQLCSDVWVTSQYFGSKRYQISRLEHHSKISKWVVTVEPHSRSAGLEMRAIQCSRSSKPNDCRHDIPHSSDDHVIGSWTCAGTTYPAIIDVFYRSLTNLLHEHNFFVHHIHSESSDLTLLT